ncbi:uncharacterized protein LOC131172001 [Hevea brasiliensis]|uniref:uncharacterized protein LOC131172001 n=1 Tax=Hevea brasiliensis TaxID=3981 RepID=UPI0025E5D190|nr:uncharacterized protein LOC131172001 [Hevea brasiliensis]
MIVILCYVDKNDCVVERFFGIVHIFDTSALSLKSSIESLFARHGLSMAILRGLGYDVTMGLLQLTLVAVAKSDIHIASLFNMIASLLNVVGASCKCRDIIQESQATEVSKALKTGETISYRRLNQETSLKRATDAHWGSHYGTILNLINMSSSVVEILNSIVKDDTSSEQRAEAYGLLELMALDNQLETYIIDVCSNDEFSTIKGIGGFTQKFVQTKKNLAYPLVYLLVKLALILYVATESVERAFSTMKTVKIRLQNWMGDQLFNDYLITYVEKDAFDNIDNKAIMQRFQKMKTH